MKFKCSWGGTWRFSTFRRQRGFVKRRENFCEHTGKEMQGLYNLATDRLPDR